MGMIDIHTHILYGVDDGSKTLEMSKQMLELSYEVGMTGIVLTPHYNHRYEQMGHKFLEDRMGELQKLATKIDPSFHLYLGNEVRYQDDIVEKLDAGKALTMNGTNYVLIEFGVGDPFSRIHRAISELQYAGYCPIIAHVERYEAIHKKEERMNQLIESGAYLQLNINSLMGGVFDREAAYNRKLVNEHKIHFLASDCHRIDWREPVTARELQFIHKKCDVEWLKKALYEHPKRMIEGLRI